MVDAVYLVRQGEEFEIFELPRPGTSIAIPDFEIEIECKEALSAAPKGKGRSVEKGTGRPADKPAKGKPEKIPGKRGPGRPKKVKPTDGNGAIPEPEPVTEIEPVVEDEPTVPTFPTGEPVPGSGGGAGGETAPDDELL